MELQVTNNFSDITSEILALAKMSEQAGSIAPELYTQYDVKRGLRDLNGKGVLAGLTNISDVRATKIVNGEAVPAHGQLFYRGYNVEDLVRGFSKDNRFGFDEVTYLLPNVLRQCLQLISLCPMLSIYGYQAYSHYHDGNSLYIHQPSQTLSMAENILHILRPDSSYTPLEAKILDIALILHMEHGGGNNSSFTTRVVTSSLSDTYSVIAAAIGSLKGPRHGGANIKVVKMFEEMKEEVHDWKDDEEISRYLARLLNKDAFDHAGLIYGVGHAVYSKSDPRAVIFKGFVERLSEEKGLHDEFELYNSVERLAPAVIAKERQMYKGVSVNVDFYSGFVYKMLGLPMELYTPIFAIARMVGWSAHRMEELATNSKIIRPAYKTLCTDQPYVELSERK